MARYNALLKQLGLSTKNLTLEEQQAMIKGLEKSPLMNKRGGRWK